MFSFHYFLFPRVKKKGERESAAFFLFSLAISMLRLAALAAARRGGGSARVAWLSSIDEIKSGLTATATATAAIAPSSSSSSSSSSFSLSVRSFAARAAPAEGGDDRKAATRNAVLVKVREF